VIPEAWRQNLNDDFKVQGLVKPGSDLTVILNSDIQDVKGLKKKNDEVTVWGGSKGVSRNESTKGLTEIRKINNKNIMVINLPTRQDVEPTSCVNQELKFSIGN
jgi:hypothetical protein